MPNISVIRSTGILSQPPHPLDNCGLQPSSSRCSQCLGTKADDDTVRAQEIAAPRDPTKEFAKGHDQEYDAGERKY